MDIIVNGENVTFKYGTHTEINFKYYKILSLFKELFASVMNAEVIDRLVIFNSKTTQSGIVVENAMHFKYDPKKHNDFDITYRITSNGIKTYEVNMDWYTIEFMCAIGDILGYDRDDYV